MLGRKCRRENTGGQAKKKKGGTWVRAASPMQAAKRDLKLEAHVSWREMSLD